MRPFEPAVVGLVAREAGSAAAWSGIPAGLRSGLEDLGCTVRMLDAGVPAPAEVLARVWLLATGRLDAHWRHAPIYMRLAEATARARRIARGGLVDGWVQMGTDFGRPVKGAVATFEDMTVAQAARSDGFFFGELPTATLAGWMKRQSAMYRAAVACCTASGWARDSIVADYGVPAVKVHVVGFGRNLDPEPKERDWSTPRFLFVGMDWERKNGPAVLRSFAQLRRDHPEARLDVVGGHPVLDLPGVVNHGRLNLDDGGHRAEIRALYETATCLVMPSRCEPFGMAYVEAGAAGVPSIGTTAGGAAEAIGPEGGLLVDPGQDGQLLDAMRRLSLPATAQAMGRAARERAASFTWRKVAERLLRSLGLTAPDGGELAGFLG
ncbi:MAG: glycosyltransferase family 4 protein [Acidimicrobiales bacterium]